MVQHPADAADNLRRADRARERGVVVQLAHQVLPRLRAALPSEGIGAWTNDSHDAITDQSHGSKVFPAF